MQQKDVRERDRSLTAQQNQRSTTGPTPEGVAREFFSRITERADVSELLKRLARK